MTPLALVPARLSDGDLLAEVARLAASEREATATLVALLAEVDARRLHLTEGCSSLFAYCTERLHLSEHAAYHRIEAARAVRAFPGILEHLRAGALTLTTVTLLRPHLTAENLEQLLAAARGRSKREVELLVRTVAPLPEVRASLRRVPATSRAEAARRASAVPVAADAKNDVRAAAPPAVIAEAPVMQRTTRGARRCSDPRCRGRPRRGDDAVGGAVLAAPAASRVAARRAPLRLVGWRRRPRMAAIGRREIRVLAPERYSLRVTLSAEGHDRLRRAQDLLRHQVPDGDPAAIVERALALLVERLERTKFAATRQRVGAQGDQRMEPAAGGSHPAGRARPTADRHRRRQAAMGAPGATRRATCSRRAIPAAVRRAVWMRDEGRCAFRGAGGRCRETGRLEFHHRIPVADGGTATVDNVELLCHRSPCV